MSSSRRPLRDRLVLPLAGLLAACLALAAGFSRRDLAARAADDSPETCVARLVAAEIAGDLPAYLGCFSEAERPKVAAVWNDRPRAQRGVELGQSAAQLTGYAVTEVDLADPREAKLVLERIFRDRHERQVVRLCREAGGWRITGLTIADPLAPRIRYGTPVTESVGREMPGERSGKP